jgi:hypothetical protein
VQSKVLLFHSKQIPRFRNNTDNLTIQHHIQKYIIIYKLIRLNFLSRLSNFNLTVNLIINILENQTDIKRPVSISVSERKSAEEMNSISNNLTYRDRIIAVFA